MRSCATFIALALTIVSASNAARIPSPTEIQVLLDQGDVDTALEALDRMLKRDPEDAEALFLRSTGRIMAGDLSGGRSDLERSLEIDPERRDGWLNRAAIDLAEADYERALEAFLRAEELAPDAPDNALNIGAVLLFSGDRDAASERFRRYLELNDNDSAAYYLVAANYAMAGRDELAVPLLKRAISLDEKTRLRARTDANFASLGTSREFQELLNTDSYRPAPDARTALRAFDIPFTGRGSRVLDATLTALQLAGAPLSAGVEVTPGWALIWSDVRIKVAANANQGTDVFVTAPPNDYSVEQWKTKTEKLFMEITLQLHSRRPSTARRPDQP